MNILGLFLAIGESWEDFMIKGQDRLLLEEKILPYSKNFDYVYIFSYGSKNFRLFSNVEIVCNKYRLHRYLYAVVMPLINMAIIRKLTLMRGLQLTGGIPVCIAKAINKTKGIINYGYNYSVVSKIEGHHVRSVCYKLIEYITLRFIDGVIVTTSTLEHQIKKYHHAVKYIPNNVNTRLFKPGVIRRDVNNLTYIGRFEKQKNLQLLIKAVSKINSCKLKVIFIGVGSQELLLKKLAAEDHVNLHIIKPQPHNQLPRYLTTTDIFVLPSLVEGHPKSLIEAMSCGLPVVGMNVEGVRDTIKHLHTGILVNNEVEMRHWLEKLVVSYKLRKKLGQNARKYVLNNYNSSLLRQKEIDYLNQFND